MDLFVQAYIYGGGANSIVDNNFNWSIYKYFFMEKRLSVHFHFISFTFLKYQNETSVQMVSTTELYET